MKMVNSGVVNNEDDMDRSHMIFTSDVSLPKDGKQLCLGKQITVGQFTEL